MQGSLDKLGYPDFMMNDAAMDNLYSSVSTCNTDRTLCLQLLTEIKIRHVFTFSYSDCFVDISATSRPVWLLWKPAQCEQLHSEVLEQEVEEPREQTGGVGVPDLWHVHVLLQPLEWADCPRRSPAVPLLRLHTPPLHELWLNGKCHRSSPRSWHRSLRYVAQLVISTFYFYYNNWIAPLLKVELCFAMLIIVTILTFRTLLPMKKKRLKHHCQM